MGTMYWVVVDVLFDDPIYNPDISLPSIEGFCQTFGCTADSEESLLDNIGAALFASNWPDDHHPVLECDISIISPGDVETEIMQDEGICEYLFGSPYNKGIWYQSSRVFIHNEDEDGEYVVEFTPETLH